jgi:hypothetical protein
MVRHQFSVLMSLLLLTWVTVTVTYTGVDIPASKLESQKMND